VPVTDELGTERPSSRGPGPPTRDPRAGVPSP